jgi:TPR repeat protein/photosystem II stability/assembly factor-like uncharacterized protein
MARPFKTILMSLVLLIGLALPVIAEQFDDALAADKRGDYATAARLYRPLAEQGNPVAQHNLGFMYSTGHGVPQSHAQAVQWWRKAAGQGYAPSQFNLGNSYHSGNGVSQNDAEAFMWWRKAAEQGMARAQTSVGLAYFYGQGVVQDNAEAVKWLQRAANRGDAFDRNFLAQMYAQGQGVKQNLPLAYRWSSLAVAQGFEPAKTTMGFVTQRLTPAELAEAKKNDEFYRRYGEALQIVRKNNALEQNPEIAKRLQAEMKKLLPKSEAEMEYIHAIQFIDATTGFALDYNGNIHETHDGGLTWAQRPMPLELDFKERLFGKLTKPFFRSPEFLAMHFADKEFGMALDRLDPVVTRDAGKTWVAVPRPPTKDELRALWCTKKRTCFVGGIPSDVIYVLRDGEKKWTQQRSNAGCCLYSIQFIDEMKGWAVSHSGSIVKTENGGSHWERVFFDKGKVFWSLHFLTDKLGFVVGNNGTVMRTFDGGNTWQDISNNIKTPMGAPREALRLQVVKFADANYGWIAGRYGLIFATDDGGDSWRSVFIHSATQSQSIYTIYALEITPQKVWAAGNTGNILLSIDNGHEWIPVHGAVLDLLGVMKRINDERAEKSEKW